MMIFVENVVAHPEQKHLYTTNIWRGIYNDQNTSNIISDVTIGLNTCVPLYKKFFAC